MTGTAPTHRASWPHVVIIGGGFGGLYAARGLAHAPVNVTVLDRTNHHLFQPLLYQVATASLSPGDITAPIRWVLRKQRNAVVLMEEVEGIDVARQRVLCDGGTAIAYDYLVLATGARHSYFRHPEWEALAPGLKSVEDGAELRRRFLLAFEQAELSDDPDEQRALLTFVIVGGGPTGVELAGAMPDIARKAMHRDFRRIDTRTTRVILVEAGPRVLPTFPGQLSGHALDDLRALGVEVRVGAPVTEISDRHVLIGDERVETRTVFWAAGNAASPLARSLGAPLDPTGRVMVEPDLSVPGLPNVYAIGDVAHMLSRGAPVPAVAPAAMQAGRYAAANIVRSLEGAEPRPFRYVNKGNLATIGRHRAVADFGRIRAAGRPAWWLWLGIHIMYLIGFRNRISVLVEWAYAYFTYQRGVRLITRPTTSQGSRDPSC
jgi:NADH:ubiquinone reductase (H+-translocating)